MIRKSPRGKQSDNAIRTVDLRNHKKTIWDFFKLVVQGSLGLPNGLIEHRLLNELTLWVYPIFLGRRKRIFTEESKARPKLVEVRGFALRTVLVRYRFEDQTTTGEVKA